LQQAAAEGGVIKDAMIATSIAQSWPCGNCANPCRRPSAIMAPASSTTSRCPSRPFPCSSNAAALIVRRLVPEGELVGYGHMGDGNLHFNVSQRPGTDRGFMARAHALEHAIFDLVGSLGGSISAEHGIGR
jgi:FAD/FMN-containing dehydrogenase